MELYAAADTDTDDAPAVHGGKYSHIRKELDWTYHQVPTIQRQRLQDALVDSALAAITDQKSWRETHCSKGIDTSHHARRSRNSDGDGDGHGHGDGGEQDITRPIALFTAG
jgi:hypothetical protein